MGRFCIVFLFVATACFPGPVLAGSAEDILKAQGGLEHTLNTLKESVARLGAENKDLEARNDKLRAQLRLAGEPLAVAQAQAVKVSAQFQELEPRYQRKLAEQSLREAQLKEALETVEALRTEHIAVENALKPKEAQDAALVAQIDALSRELGDIRSGLVSGQDHTAELEALRTEQSSLQKDIDVSSKELKRVTDEWKELTVAINAGPGQVDMLVKEQATLKGDSARLGQEIDGLRQKLAIVLKEAQDTELKYSVEFVAQMEQDIQELEVQSQALEKEVADTEKTLHGSKLTPSAEAKLKKDEARLRELVQHNRDLRMGLKNLQRTMVSMDRKKSDFEKTLDNAPAH